MTTATKIYRDRATDALGSFAAETVMRGAAFHLKNVGYLITEDNAERAVSIVRRHAKGALTEALADAKEALDANMPDAAIATLKASFWLAGIRAGKEIAGV